MTRSTTPYRYLIHHKDGLFTKMHKRAGRFAWRRGWIKRTRADVMQGVASSGNLSEGERQEFFRKRPR